MNSMFIPQRLIMLIHVIACALFFIIALLEARISSERDFSTVLEKLRPHSSKWRDIGVGLGFTPSELDTIEAAPRHHPTAPKSFLSAMLSDWLEWAPGDARGSMAYANRDSLINAVDKAGLGRTAQELYC